MDQNEIADAFDEFAGDRDRSSQSATAAFWEFCEDNSIGQSLIGDSDLELKVREILSGRGWGINMGASFLGENPKFEDGLDAVLNNA